MKKNVLLMVLMCSIVCILSGCGDGSDKKKNEADSTPVNVTELANRISTEITFEDSVSKLENSVALKYYGIDEAIVKECAIYISTGATAEEIAVFEANSSADADTIYKACDDRRTAQINSYKDYKPSEVDRLENYVLQKKGSYVIFCVADDKEKVQSIADEVIK